MANTIDNIGTDEPVELINDEQVRDGLELVRSGMDGIRPKAAFFLTVEDADIFLFKDESRRVPRNGNPITQGTTFTVTPLEPLWAVAQSGTAAVTVELQDGYVIDEVD